MPSPASRRLPALACAAVVVAVAAPAVAQPRINDPWEGTNRQFFAVNQFLDRTFLRPAAMAWKTVVPGVVREGLRNALSNLGEPVVFVNDMIQGRADDGSVTLKRFVINSTVGMAGLADVAKAHKLPHHDNGFGTTLGRYGAKTGPYVYLPVLGPGDVRDLIGSGVDVLTNPQTWINYGARTPVGIAEGVSGGLNARADADGELETLKATATDEYATLRSLYLQNREAQVRGEQVDINDLPSFDDPTAHGTAPAAPGSRSATGAPPIKRPGPNAPSGDAGALPSAAPTTPPDPAAPAPAQPPPGEPD